MNDRMRIHQQQRTKQAKQVAAPERLVRGSALPASGRDAITLRNRTLDTVTAGPARPGVGYEFGHLTVHRPPARLVLRQQRVRTRDESSGEEEKAVLSTPKEAAGGQTEFEVPPIVSRVVQTGGGQRLDDRARAFMEQCFGFDFSQVRIHTGAAAANAARAVNARAYTLGHDIVFSGGQYAPDTLDGRRLLAHELTHVAQAKRAGAAAPETGVSKSNDASEKEAARNSTLAAAGACAELAVAPTAAVQRQAQQTGNPPPAAPLQPQPQTSTPPPDPNAPQMSPETQRQLIYAATVLSHVPAMPKDQEARLDQAIGGSELYRLITKRNGKRDELDRLKNQPPSLEQEGTYGAQIELLGKEVDRLNQAIASQEARLNMSVDEVAFLNFVEQEFPKLWIDRAKTIANTMLEQNKDVVNKEMGRYQANVCSADIEGLRNADAALNKLATELDAMTKDKDSKQARIDQLDKDISLPGGLPPNVQAMQAEQNGLKAEVNDLLPKIEAKKSELQETQNHYAVEYPVLFLPDYKPGSLYQSSPEELESTTGKWMQQILNNIAETEGNIDRERLKVWNLPDVPSLTFQSLGVATESVLGRAVMNYIQGKVSDEQALQTALMVLGMAAGIVAAVATAGGALLVAAAAAGLGTGLTIGQLIVHVDQYQAESAAERVALDPLMADISANDPEILPIVMDVIALGLDTAVVMGALRAASRAAMMAGDLDQFAAAARRSLPPAQAEALIQQTARRLGKAGVPQPPGPYTVLSTKEGGDVFKDVEMTKTLVAEHPDLAGFEASLRPLGATLAPEPSLAAPATADIRFIRVTGPGEESFTRALIRYHPKRAVLQDLWHELNHLQDFQAGRIPPPYVVQAKDAAEFAELQGKSVQDLIKSARAAVPKIGELAATEVADSQVRSYVAEIRNYLRDIEELSKAVDSPYVENAYKAVRQYREVLGIMVKTGNVRAARFLTEAERDALRDYIRQYISDQFPELPAEYARVFPKQDFWAGLQRKPFDGAHVPLAAVARAKADRSPGRPLEPTVRRPMEARLGASFADVRIHTDARAASLAEGVHADAFTQARDIYFGAGRYQPGTFDGYRLLAHELTHVIQHIKGIRTVISGSVRAHEHETQDKGGRAAQLPLFPEASLQTRLPGGDQENPFEKEADRIADLAMRMFTLGSRRDVAVPVTSKAAPLRWLGCREGDEEERN